MPVILQVQKEDKAKMGCLIHEQELKELRAEVDDLKHRLRAESKARIKVGHAASKTRFILPCLSSRMCPQIITSLQSRGQGVPISGLP